jgi:hypothetical protein
MQLKLLLLPVVSVKVRFSCILGHFPVVMKLMRRFESGCAFLGCEGNQEGCDAAPRAINGAFCELSQERFERAKSCLVLMDILIGIESADLSEIQRQLVGHRQKTKHHELGPLISVRGKNPHC